MEDRKTKETDEKKNQIFIDDKDDCLNSLKSYIYIYAFYPLYIYIYI